jgi:hypothetical protein
MTHKLEETFNLPPMISVDDHTDDDDDDDFEYTSDDDQLSRNLIPIDEMESKLREINKIDSALGVVGNLEALDSDLDDYAKRAMDAFEDLLDLGKNVEDRHCASIFDSAAKMMGNALTAKTAKADRKLKVIQLQLQQQKLELEEKKLALKKVNPSSDDESEESAQVHTMSRNDLLTELMNKMKEQQQQGK